MVEVNLIGIKKNRSQKDFIDHPLLDGNEVPFISAYLDDFPEYQPHKLNQNQGYAFIGEVIRGIGFVISKTKANNLLEKEPINRNCLRPYLIGNDINNDPQQRASRYVICFENWPLEEVMNYPELLRIVEKKVKPQRMKLPPNSSDYRKLREKWWQFARFGLEMREKIKSMEKVLLRSRVSEIHMLTFLNTGHVFSDAVVVFAYDDFFHFSVLQSWIHESWIRRQASTLRTDLRYTPTDCFQTFPFPQNPNTHSIQTSESAGKTYYETRQKILLNTQKGLTDTYNRFHDRDCFDEDMKTMRQLHTEVDRAVLQCYDWDDITLEHDFYRNDRGKTRFMPSRDAQREIYTRLITLNHEIAADETSKNDR